MTIELDLKGRCATSNKQIRVVKKAVLSLLERAKLDGGFTLTITDKKRGIIHDDITLVRREASGVKLGVKADPNSHFQCFLNGGGLSPRQLWNALAPHVEIAIGKNGGVELAEPEPVEEDKPKKAKQPSSEGGELVTDNKMRGFSSRPEDVEFALLAIDEHLEETGSSEIAEGELRSLLAQAFDSAGDGRTFRPIFESFCRRGHLILREEDGQKLYSRPATTSGVPAVRTLSETSSFLEKLQGLEAKVTRYKELAERLEVLNQKQSELDQEIKSIKEEISSDGLNEAVSRLEEISKLL